jgi:hypothetical protein
MLITGRFRRRDFGHIDLEIRYDDPKYYTRPFIDKTTLHLFRIRMSLSTSARGTKGIGNTRTSGEIKSRPVSRAGRIRAIGEAQAHVGGGENSGHLVDCLGAIRIAVVHERSPRATHDDVPLCGRRAVRWD